jgi:hypothetical protein
MPLISCRINKKEHPRGLRTRFIREQDHRLLLVMDMDDQAAEQSGDEGPFVILFADDYLLKPRRPGFPLLLTFEQRVHKMQNPTLAPRVQVVRLRRMLPRHSRLAKFERESSVLQVRHYIVT